MNLFVDKPVQKPENDLTEGLQIVSYIPDETGRQELVAGSMWHPVDVVNKQAWAVIAQQIGAAEAKVRGGRASCLYYYMIANQMDIGLLSRYTDQSPWQVRLHLMPYFFRRLSEASLKKYSELFKISITDLLEGRLQPPVSMQHNNEAESFA